MLATNLNRDLVDHFLAFANPTRLRILQRIAHDGEISVNELAATLRMSQPRISWHLRMLRTGGVIQTRREGRLKFCSLDVNGIRDRQDDLRQLLGMNVGPGFALPSRGRESFPLCGTERNGDGR